MIGDEAQVSQRVGVSSARNGICVALYRSKHGTVAWCAKDHGAYEGMIVAQHFRDSSQHMYNVLHLLRCHKRKNVTVAW